MKTSVCALPALALAVLLAAGCDRADPKKPPPPITGQVVPVTDVPKMPDPVVAKGDESPTPKPGQANDHSNPAFKDGGASVPK